VQIMLRMKMLLLSDGGGEDDFVFFALAAGLEKNGVEWSGIVA